MKRTLRALGAGVASIVFVASALLWSGSSDTTPLASDLPREAIRLPGGTRDALAPSFPSSLELDIEIPERAYLDLALALVMESAVPRARVEYRVTLESEGERVLLYARFVDVAEANLWHDERFDLTPWGGRSARILLETRSDPPRSRVLWADRVRTVWSGPALVTDGSGRALAALHQELAAFGARLEQEAAEVGVSAEDRISLSAFGLNLVGAGLVSLLFSTVFHARTRSLVPLLALATTLVIAVVHLSVPLSLGLMGALSILRFRAAIPRGEDLIPLLAAVAIGLAFGAGERLIAAVGAAVVATFVLVLGKSKRRGSFHRQPRTLEAVVSSGSAELLEAVGRAALIDDVMVEKARTRLRVVLPPGQDAAVLSKIWKRFPDARATWS